MRNYYDVKTKYLINNWKKLSTSEIRGLVANVSWFNICMSEHLTCKFVKKFENYIEWRALSANPYITQDIIVEYRDRFDMNFILSLHLIDEEIIMDNLDYFIKYAPSLLKYQSMSLEGRSRVKMLYELSL